MQADKIVLPYIDIVRPFAKVKIKYTNGIYLFYFFVGVAEIDMLGNSLCHPIEYALQIIQLTCVLYLHDDDVPFAIFRLDVNSVKLVVGFLLITLAFQYVDNLDRLTDKHCKESLKYSKVSLLTKQSFECPIESNVFIF